MYGGHLTAPAELYARSELSEHARCTKRKKISSLYVRSLSDPTVGATLSRHVKSFVSLLLVY